MARPKNPNAKPRKEVTGRKYLVLSAEEWDQFKGTREVYGSIDKAQEAADALATAADDSQPGVAHRFAIVEEAGILSTEVQKKVARTFSSSRTVTRAKKSEAIESSEPLPLEEVPTTDESTTEQPRKRRH